MTLDQRWIARPDTFKREIEALWTAMNEGATFGFEKILRFNGGLFAEPVGLSLTRAQLELHDALDRAVAAAYGWPVDLSDEALLEKLVGLNAQRADEERQGHIRWLRPEFQNPGGGRDAAQTTLPGVDASPAAEEEAVPATEPWPKKLPEQIAAVRARVLRSRGSWELEPLARGFKGARRKDVEQALESLVMLGLLVRYEQDGTPRWSAPRTGTRPFSG